MDLTALKLNKYQTKYTNEMLQKLPDMVIQWLEDAISNHVFIQRLISKDRPLVKDCDPLWRVVLAIVLVVIKQIPP